MPSNDLTILLPLKGRDDFSVRWFNYAARHVLPYKVLVADGGRDEGLEARLRQGGIFDKIDCDYMRYPFDSDLELFFRKMADALSRVETPYVVIANNDDFIFFDALASSVAVLDANPDFAAARGEIWDFAVAPGTPLAPVYGRMTALRKLYFHPDVVGDTALERVSDLARKFHATGHEITRTPIAANAYARIVKDGVFDIRFAERISTFLSAVGGKIHRGDGLYMLHQSHADMSALTHFKRPAGWINGADWDRDFDIFAGSMASAIAEVDGIEFYRAKSEIMKIATRHFLDLVTNDLRSGEPTPPPRIRHALVESAKWLIRRIGPLERLARGIHSGAKSRADIKAVPPSFTGKIAEIERFLNSPPAGI